MFNNCQRGDCGMCGNCKSRTQTMSEEELEENIACITWEERAKKLWQLLDDVDSLRDCVEITGTDEHKLKVYLQYTAAIREIVAKKNKILSGTVPNNAEWNERSVKLAGLLARIDELCTEIDGKSQDEYEKFDDDIHEIHQTRFNVLSTDGYKLFVPEESV